MLILLRCKAGITMLGSSMLSRCMLGPPPPPRMLGQIASQNCSKDSAVFTHHTASQNCSKDSAVLTHRIASQNCSKDSAVLTHRIASQNCSKDSAVLTHRPHQLYVLQTYTHLHTLTSQTHMQTSYIYLWLVIAGGGLFLRRAQGLSGH